MQGLIWWCNSMVYPLFYHEIGVSDLIQINVLIKRTKKKKKEKRKKKKKIVRVINILLRLMERQWVDIIYENHKVWPSGFSTTR